MALPVDTTSAVRGPSARLALVKALRDASTSEPETDWIEWLTARLRPSRQGKSGDRS